MSTMMGFDGNFFWWMGIVENRNDPLKVGRCQVRIFAWNDANKAVLPTKELLWAHPVTPLGSTQITPPKEGVMVFGFFMDGKLAQNPVMLGQVPGIPDTAPPDPSQGFSDPRTNSQLQSAPRPPQATNYNTSGSGATINEASSAKRFPSVLNQPMTYPTSRNENLEGTPIEQRQNSLITAVPTGTGTLAIGGVDVEAFLAAQITLPSITIPPFAAGINLNAGFEICGIGIDASLSAGFNFSGITLGLPTITIGGEILLGGIPIDILLSGAIALGEAISLAVDIAGCLLGGLRLGNFIQIDGGLMIPLLPHNKFINFSSIGIRGTTYGGVSLGTMGGIPLSTPPMWNEPPPPYNAQYPYNNAVPSESGHLIEIDDTPGHERIHTFHRSGTFTEMQPDGSVVSKQVKNNYNITYADNNQYTMGDHNITVNGQATNLIQQDSKYTIQGNETNITQKNQTNTILGSQTESITKDVTQTLMQNRFVDVKGNDTLIVEGNQHIVVIGDCGITVKGKCTLAVAGTLEIGSTGDTNLTVGGNFNVTITGQTNITSEQTNIKSPVNITGQTAMNGDLVVTGEITRGIGTSDSVRLGSHTHHNGVGTTGGPVAGT